MEMKPTVVLFPGLGMGHLTPMVELAKLFINCNFSVTILVLDSPFDSSSAIAPFISRISSTFPSISFHHLPKVPLPPLRQNPNLLASIFDLIRLSTPHISNFLKPMLQTFDIRALILGFFCTETLDVAAELGIPAYFLFSSSASNLAACLLLPTIQSQTAASFKDLGDEPINIPGVPPIPASHMMGALQDRNDEMHSAFIRHLERLPRAAGIMINTFESLEKRAVQALVDGLCLPGRRMPPFYCIGPLIADGVGGEEEKHECLKWLDAQPKGSVVFLCFGSMGSFPAAQLKEIAVGLEKSEQRFLWVVRSPPSSDPEKRFGPRPEPDLTMLMPEGFMDRTEVRGMVVKSWAPQTAVLGHESVGGFVCHCGWNSTLEAVSAGVPIIAWPLYAEQRMNKVFLTEEAKLAVEMQGYDKEMVSAEEVETKIRWLMESEGGRELRDRAVAMKGKAEEALKDGGSSSRAWMELVSGLNKGSD